MLDAQKKSKTTREYWYAKTFGGQLLLAEAAPSVSKHFVDNMLSLW